MNKYAISWLTDNCMNLLEELMTTNNSMKKRTQISKQNNNVLVNPNRISCKIKNNDDLSEENPKKDSKKFKERNQKNDLSFFFLNDHFYTNTP